MGHLFHTSPDPVTLKPAAHLKHTAIVHEIFCYKAIC